MIMPLSKRDYHAAIAAFSFGLQAVNFENEGAFLFFPRLLYEGYFLKRTYEFACCQGY